LENLCKSASTNYYVLDMEKNSSLPCQTVSITTRQKIKCAAEVETNLVEIFASKERLIASSMKLSRKRVRLCSLLPGLATAVTRYRVIHCAKIVRVTASQYRRAAWTAQWTCDKLNKDTTVSKFSSHLHNVSVSEPHI